MQILGGGGGRGVSGQVSPPQKSVLLSELCLVG